MKEYDFIKITLENGDNLFLNLMKIAICVEKENIVEFTLLNGNQFVLSKAVCNELIQELNFWSVNEK